MTYSVFIRAIIFSIVICTVGVSVVNATDDINVTVTDISLAYEPFDGLDQIEPLNITVTYSGTVPQNGLLVLRPIIPGQWQLLGAVSSLQFELRPGAVAGGLLLGDQFQIPISLNAGNPTQTFAINVVLPDQQYAEAGAYIGEMQVEFIDPTTTTFLVGAQTIQIDASVASRAEANIAGGSGAFDDGATFATIDFEELESGERRDVSVQIRATAETIIRLNSDNAGRLVNTAAPQHSVDYTVVFDQIPTSLETPLEITRRPPRTLDGGTYPLSVEIGDVAGAAEGAYTDIIHIDVFPQ